VLRDRLLSNEDKLSDLNEKKSLLEKQGSKALEQMKEFEDKIEKSSQALSKKDSEIDELNTKLSSKDQEYSKINTDLTELKEKLVIIIIIIREIYLIIFNY
jgi:chromosome segregation ATPase